MQHFSIRLSVENELPGGKGIHDDNSRPNPAKLVVQFFEKGISCPRNISQITDSIILLARLFC